MDELQESTKFGIHNRHSVFWLGWRNDLLWLGGITVLTNLISIFLHS